MPNLRDTIVAVSSPPGRSARGLVRLDGPHAFAVVAHLVDHPPDPPPHTARPAALRHPDLPPLPVLLTRFPGPRSYTGHDVAELQLPGHPALLDRVLQAALGHPPLRLAEPGEFTFRAYTAGKLDLTRAEGVAATIHAVSDSQLAAAAALRHGQLARFAAGRVDRVGRLLALVEAGIDFVDQEDVVPIPPRELAAALTEELRELEKLLARSRAWGAVEALPRVVLLGPPSAGKSTLFNALLGQPRAVTHPAPGTTRDVLEEPLQLNPLPTSGRGDAPSREVMLVDLAGLDDAATALDRDVQQRVRDAVDRADLILHVRPAAGPADAARAPLALPAAAPVLRVYTKADRVASFSAPPGPDADAVCVSAHTGRGLPALRAAILHHLGDRAVSLRADLLALQPRHHAALTAAREALQDARRQTDPGAPALGAVELVAGRLRDALDHLAGLGGELTPDDVIGRVFSTFCVGK
ncbi:MAG: GTPase [Planctomycetota bacterium]